MSKLFTAENKATIKYAGLASIATALVSFAVNKMIEIQLGFWELLGLLIVGIGVFVYMDLKGKNNEE
jgi:hypothetical protein